jgi:hypothetical protein
MEGEGRFTRSVASSRVHDDTDEPREDCCVKRHSFAIESVGWCGGDLDVIGGGDTTIRLTLLLVAQLLAIVS